MSKALECLKKIENEYSIDEAVFYKEDFNQIRKELKALEIIKEKKVDVFRFKKLDFNTFNQLKKSCKLPELTEEEFNLLKEVLDNVGN